jgi:sugar phosphate isomerase/epimerase
MNRRSFMECTALAVSAVAAPSGLATEWASTPARPIVVFTKFLEKLPFDELAERIAALGVSGLEAPVRPGGHLNPDEVEEKLPLFVEALKSQGLDVAILTTGIDSIDRAGKTERFLKLAASLGIRRYRLGYLKYDLTRPIAPQIATFRARLTDLAALNAEVGIQGQYQNHRGNDFVGAPVWDIVDLLSGIDPVHLGLAFDFAHATVEGANAWELNLRRAAPHVVSVYFKDYRLEGNRWEACPLGQGIVHRKAASLTRELLPSNTPISLHIEYISGPAEGRAQQTLDAMHNDLGTLAAWMRE